MAFEPFGYKFDIQTHSDAESVKSAIRKKMKRWFDLKNGARGWIAGPFICLWFSAFDRQGPMLLGLISRDNLGTRIHGRAGSDINSVAMSSLIMFVVMLAALPTTVSRGTTAGQYLVCASIFAVGAVIIYGIALLDRRDAEPLVRFLRDTVAAPGLSLRSRFAPVAISNSIGMVVDGDQHEGPLTAEMIHDALLEIGTGNFVILETGPEDYLQTIGERGGYVIEKREGDALSHFGGIHTDRIEQGAKMVGHLFSFEEVLPVFLAYASGDEAPAYVRWELIDLKS